MEENREKEKKDQNLHIRLTKSQLDFIEMVSYEDDKTKTDMILKAVEFYHNLKKGGFG